MTFFAMCDYVLVMVSEHVTYIMICVNELIGV